MQSDIRDTVQLLLFINPYIMRWPLTIVAFYRALSNGVQSF